MRSDARLVDHVRRGSQTAFEVLFDRHYGPLLAFSAHLLGSLEEAEEAVQQTFLSAYCDLRSHDRPVNFKSWVFTILRNHCVSLLRKRGEESSPHPRAEPPVEQRSEPEPSVELSEQVDGREEIRELLNDLAQLPVDQRAALLLAEARGLRHEEVARVLDCEPAKIKALIFQARSSLIKRRRAREVPCEEIREQIAVGGAVLRRAVLRHHLRECPACRRFRDAVRHQRSFMALALPVVPSHGFRDSVLGAARDLRHGGGDAVGPGAETSSWVSEGATAINAGVGGAHEGGLVADGLTAASGSPASVVALGGGAAGATSGGLALSGGTAAGGATSLVGAAAAQLAVLAVAGTGFSLGGASVPVGSGEQPLEKPPPPALELDASEGGDGGALAGSSSGAHGPAVVASPQKDRQGVDAGVRQPRTSTNPEGSRVPPAAFDPLRPTDWRDPVPDLAEALPSVASELASGRWPFSGTSSRSRLLPDDLRSLLPAQRWGRDTVKERVSSAPTGSPELRHEGQGLTQEGHQGKSGQVGDEARGEERNRDRGEEGDRGRGEEGDRGRGEEGDQDRSEGSDKEGGREKEED